MVGDAVLGKVVGADPLGAVHGAHLRAASGVGLGRGGRCPLSQEAGTQDPQGRLLVLQLRLLVLHGHHDAGGQVGEPHGGVGGVDALPARTGGAEDVDAQVGRVDLELTGVVHLRHHEHPGS